MAEVAVIESTAIGMYPSGRVRSGAVSKRKTPSELRGEQLKRKNHGPPAEMQSTDVVGGHKKAESYKIPKYINTRVNEIYPVKKFSDKWRTLQGKEKSKASFINTRIMEEHSESPTMANPGPNERSLPFSEEVRSSSAAGSASPVLENVGGENSCKLEKCSHSTFRTVKDLSVGDKGLQCHSNIDMEKALKGLVVREAFDSSLLLTDSTREHGAHSSFFRKFCSEINISGYKAPLDFTLKTALRLVSSSSVKWFHRLHACSTYGDILQFSNASEPLYSKALHTWRYPQSPLPPSVISVMAFSSSKSESDFLLKRQQDWEDSFRSLYYMLRKSTSHMFYVHTTQFVAMFIAGNFSGKKRCCNAYLSQSTRGLRSLLREHDICFSMPLCHSEPEQAAVDDLAELSEIEKQNLGQTIHVDSLSDVDGSPKSLLAFIGNDNAHALYDFLLNYRYFSTSLTGVDVPVLCSPVPFPNASICTPEVKCKEMKRADTLAFSSGSDTDDGKSLQNPTISTCYTIEIKDAILPPWVISRLCAVMGSEGRSFELDFTTEPMSTGLNVAVDSVCRRTTPAPESEKWAPVPGDALGVAEAVITPQLSSAFLKSLRYGDGSYEARLAPL